MDAQFLHNPIFWIATAFLLFFLLAGKKVFVALVRALDARSDKINLELTQARKLRMEAEEVLADYKRKQAEYLKEAERMLAKARKDAEEYGKLAQAELQASLDARMKQALDKISREEEKAIEDVRNHVVDISLAAARAIIVEHMGNISQDELTKVVIGDIGRKIH